MSTGGAPPRRVRPLAGHHGSGATATPSRHAERIAWPARRPGPWARRERKSDQAPAAAPGAGRPAPSRAPSELDTVASRSKMTGQSVSLPTGIRTLQIRPPLLMGGHMDTQPTQTGSTLPAAGPGTRASDADRDAAAGLLNEAFAAGRLTADEHDQRLSAAYAARSWPELHQLTADLPAPPGADLPAPLGVALTAQPGVDRPAPSGAADRMAPGVFGGVDLCVLCALLVVCPPAGI